MLQSTDDEVLMLMDSLRYGRDPKTLSESERKLLREHNIEFKTDDKSQMNG